MHLAYFAHFSFSALKIIMKCLFPLHRTTIFQGSQLREETSVGAPRRSEKRDEQKDGPVGAETASNRDQILTLL